MAKCWSVLLDFPGEPVDVFELAVGFIIIITALQGDWKNIWDAWLKSRRLWNISKTTVLTAQNSIGWYVLHLSLKSIIFPPVFTVLLA